MSLPMPITVSGPLFFPPTLQCMSCPFFTGASSFLPSRVILFFLLGYSLSPTSEGILGGSSFKKIFLFLPQAVHDNSSPSLLDIVRRFSASSFSGLSPLLEIPFPSLGDNSPCLTGRTFPWRALERVLSPPFSYENLLLFIPELPLKL